MATALLSNKQGPQAPRRHHCHSTDLAEPACNIPELLAEGKGAYLSFCDRAAEGSAHQQADRTECASSRRQCKASSLSQRCLPTWAKSYSRPPHQASTTEAEEQPQKAAQTSWTPCLPQRVDSLDT
ncbi:Hypothetical predicted protein [Pelobates cultripes]|uniref:Uncharacterized protein n=1 Tax=Pelobates cultripes TaxID=61616 RepID=A0AAD1WN66_PELCU|nr:Hypothetical predicted protein [Pelobates cultripes]